MEQRYEVGRMRINHVQVGQAWMMEAPKRLVRVVEETMIELPDDQKRMRQEPCFVCQATVPVVPIKGHVTKKEAAGNVLLRRGIEQEAATDPDDTPADYQWTEVWAERFLFGLTRHPRWPVLAVNDAEGAPKYPILCCVKTMGRDTTRKASSPIEGTRLGGALINPHDLPAGLFGETDASEKPEAAEVGVRQEGGEVGAEAPLRQPGQATEAGTQEEAQELPQTVKGLRKLAAAEQIGVSGIHGKGAVKLLQERITFIREDRRKYAELIGASRGG